MQIAQRRQLIIGCGYLGKELARQLLALGASVTATTRKENNLAPLTQAGVQVCLFDLESPQTWSDLMLNLGEVELDIYLLVPPSQIRRELFSQFVDKLQSLNLHSALLASSTVVYGQAEREVDADSEVDIDSDRAERQFTLEQVWSAAGERMKLVRFAGLYGPDRIIGKRTLLKGQALPGRGDAWLNLIHISDAASLLSAMVEKHTTAAIELGCDGLPVLRKQYYSDLAQHIGAKPPVFSGEQEDISRGRRCSNSVTCERTGWQPTFLRYVDSF